MPRNQHPGPSALRNRNRVTNKTRLRIVKGSIDADPLAFDEDDEKARVVSTAGVDAEDANEHHLQAVLSAASRNQASVARPTRGSIAEKAPKQPHQPQPDAYIPIPDSTGLVENYEEHYPADRWTDPKHYLKTSDSVEESISDSLANGFTYSMDERDKEWLDKNNEGARGEGTSAQGALSSSGTTTRSGLSSRSAKAKGKEPDVPHAIHMSEDEFELVMGIFEKVTHEKTEFLHHGLEQGAPFPPYSDYHETFSMPLMPNMFASFKCPPWLPPPQHLQRLAKVVYPYWKERRIERGGLRVIPVLNYDESDTKNESYICFRRRDVKAMRKTRASQASSSDKLRRLGEELKVSLQLAQQSIQREALKLQSIRESQAVWETRQQFVQLKRKFPALGVTTKEEEELLFDKEKPAKRIRVDNGGRIRIQRTPHAGSPAQPETIIRPKEHAAAISRQVEREMLKLKEADHLWEDGIDNAYQAQPIPYQERFWKYIPRPSVASTSRSSPSDPEEEVTRPHWRAVRTRRGRGGVLRMDRRVHIPTSSRHKEEEILRLPRRSEQEQAEEDPSEVQELSWRIRDRWKFDHDDEPTIGPDGPDEHDRVLVDDFDDEHLRKRMSLVKEQDYQRLATNPVLRIPMSDGRIREILPYRMSVTLPRSYPYGRQVPHPQSGQLIMQRPPQGQSSVALSSGAPISMQMKNVQVPSGVVQRLSAMGGMRPPSTPRVAVPQPGPQNSQSSPSHPSTPVQSVNGHNGTNNHPSNGSESVSRPTSAASLPAPDTTSGSPITAASHSPLQHKTSNGHHVMSMPNGYHFSNHHFANNPQLMMQFMQQANPKQFAGQEIGTVNGSRPAAYIGQVAPNGATYNLPGAGVNGNGSPMVPNLPTMTLKPPPASRAQMQWPNSQGQPSPEMRRQAHLSPSQGRASSHGLTMAHSSSPHLSPGPQGQAAAVSVSSPSVQQQQMVGGSGVGY